MISTEVLVAIISGVCVAIPSLITTIMMNNKNQAVVNAKFEENNKLIEYKINELTKSVDRYNDFIERIISLEQSQKAMWKRIDEFKDKLNERQE